MNEREPRLDGIKGRRRLVLASLLSGLGLILSASCSALDPSAVEPLGDTGPLSFEEYERATSREPETGYYLVGDQAFPTVDALRSYYDSLDPSSGLIVHKPGGVLSFWDTATKKNLRYCVSTSFGSNYGAVVTAMSAAVAAWEAQGDIDFIHDTTQDSSCNASNNNVLFDVSPASANATYYARAFFPDYARSARNILVHSSAFAIGAPLTLGGVLRHELGHALGFRHEHTRPESASCFEDNAWYALTPYDSGSVMHYPWCNGTNSSDLNLTALDARGTAILYGKNGLFRLRHQQTGKCIFGDLQDGGSVKNWTCWNDPNMVYSMDPLPSNRFRLHHGIHQKCVYGNPTNGGTVRNWGCWDDPNMVFAMEPVGDNTFRLRHDQTGKCLYGNPTNGGTVGNWGCWDDPNMVFAMEPTGPNQARAATVTAQSTYPGYSVQRINDGDTSTNLGGAYSWANIYGSNGLLPQTVDLTWTSSRQINMAVVHTTQGYELQNYDVQYWDGSSWVTLIVITGNTAVKRTHVFPTITSSRIRIVARKGPAVQPGYVRLNEVEVY